MSLQVWLPLNGNLKNNGLSNITITNNGATINDNGKIGKCYYFNNNTMIFTPTFEAISICFWIKTEKQSSTIVFVDYQSKMGFGFLSTNNILVSCRNLRTSQYNHQNFIENQWNHIALVKKNNDILLYINGQQQVNRLSDNTYWTHTVNACYLGGRSTGNNIVCYLNDFRMYNHQLSENQIKEISKGLILHYPLNRQCWGQENLLLNSNIEKSGESNVAQWFRWNLNNLTLTTNIDYTLSFDAKMSNSDVFYIGFANNDSTQEVLAQGVSVTTKYKRYIFTKQTSKTNINSIVVSNYKGYGRGNNNNTTGTLYIKNIKLEIGNKATPWCPNAADDIYTTLGLGNNIQYDISGYQNNGVKNNITYDNDTPKYDVSSVFTSTNTSYIKVNENNWMPQYQEAMTINLWAYSSNWASTTKLFSCTQSGGWNTESGNSGYARFPIYVATNQAHTSHKYKYNSQELKVSDLAAGWHMLTFIYDSTGNKVYIDGQLHSSYAFTSYGIKYNTNARLFLGCEAASASPTTPYLNGKISDFRIYVTALSAEDILSLYNNEAEIDKLEVDSSFNNIVGEGLVGYMTLKQ